jgi:hypothetical protein
MFQREMWVKNATIDVTRTLRACGIAIGSYFKLILVDDIVIKQVAPLFAIVV